jgi:hypothetical protein
MTEEKYYRSRETIEKIMSGFDEVGSYGIALVGHEIHVHYYLHVETVQLAPGQATITIKGQVLPRYAGPVKQIVEQKILAYLGKSSPVKMIKMTREEFDSLDIEFATRKNKTVARRTASIKWK